jgi:hypothetical protein
MKKILFLITLHFCFVLPQTAGATWNPGGKGATCAPTLNGYPGCALVAIPWSGSVTKTVSVSGGTWTTPYQANQANTKYVLQANAIANSTGFVITADYVIIDLNGYTITYNQTSAGNGVAPGGWNIDHVAVINGSIIQGAANSGSSDAYGIGSNPIGDHNVLDKANYGFGNLQVSNVFVEYSGNNLSGIASDTDLVAESIIKDNRIYGTIVDRHIGPNAVGTSQGVSGVIRNNTIINAKQKGIKLYNGGQAYQNVISLNSQDTNSYAISSYDASNTIIRNNTITGGGVHPIGIGIMNNGVSNVQVYANKISLQKTMNGGDGSGDTATGIRCGSYAGGEYLSNISIYRNEINITTASSYAGKNASNGSPAPVVSKGKGLFLGTWGDGPITVANNLINMTGTGSAYGIAPHCNNSDNLYIIKNTIKSHDANVVLEDDYCNMVGYPVFEGNNFVRVGSEPGYYTFASKLNGYYNQAARFVDNTYSDGAAENSVNLSPEGSGTLNAYFGYRVGSEYRFTYRLHDGGTQTFSPYTTLSYAVAPNYDTWNAPPTGESTWGDVAAPAPPSKLHIN